MRKAIVLLVAMAMVAATAIPVMATDFSWSGDFLVRGRYFDNKYDGSDDIEDDVAYFDQRVRLNMTAKVSDRVSLHTRFILIGIDDWDSKGIWASGPNPSFVHGAEADVDVDRCYLDLHFPDFLGGSATFSIGRWIYGIWGNQLTFAQESAYMWNFIHITPKVIWGLMFAHVIEGSYNPDDTIDLTSDQSALLFGGGVGVNGGDEDVFEYAPYIVVPISDWGVAGVVLAEQVNYWNGLGDNTYNHVLCPYFNMTRGNFSLKSELGFDFGDVWLPALLGQDSVDQDDAWAIYLEPSYKWGPGEIGLQFIYASGDDPDSEDYEGYPVGDDMDIGYIMFEHVRTTSLQGNNWLSEGLNENFMSIKVWATCEPWEKWWFKAHLLWAQCNEDIPFTRQGMVQDFKKLMNGDIPDDIDADAAKDGDDYGVELCLRAAYNITPELKYGVDFAVLWPDDAFTGSNFYDNEDDDEVIALTHYLTFKF